MTRDILIVDSGTGPRRIHLGEYLDAAAEERARVEAHNWIKRVRHASVDGQPLRRRFTLREDSLWWFAELYLHKQGIVLELFRAIAALHRAIERERPLEIRVVSANRLIRELAPQIARARNVRCRGGAGPGSRWLRIARLDLRARGLALASRVSRLKPRVAAPHAAGPTIAAFVHTAFWRTGAGDRGAESYIGPVLATLEQRNTMAVTYVGVGPASNFRARRWWHALRSRTPAALVPVESLAPIAALRDSRRLWRERHAVKRALWRSADLRHHAVIAGADCWPAIREELAGIALLQWPWSARAMDEAGAALDALRPSLALTYAEAGGWGRALMLECRRRGIPSVGLQHGFIYRHWLNYRHEPDEMLPDPDHPADRGFPRPTLTLLFDDYARRHLEQDGRFPPESLAVTGSPRLDALAGEAAALDAAGIARARDDAGAADSRAVVLVVTKYREARHILPALTAAVAGMPDVQLAIKTHPAETPEAYTAVIAGAPNVRVLPAAAALAPLLRASRAVVTVNSTVALDAAVLGIPTLVIGLPNNLSPFVDAGLMTGARTPAEIAPALARILYDEGFRLQHARDRSASLARFAIGSDGRASARSADAVLALIARRTSAPAQAGGGRTKG